ncbi:hypothetical protein NM208_g14323 [Fusarium decemcellulare]|uniref:Uncharacterized protein n=1 Tax=Fusarium decemcellulare TaxID=57161 RepID=A0ACC1RGF5_9HYPO|nr:hypothetical protein NM208_g14323 [Fusarium decemcellulare]
MSRSSQAGGMVVGDEGIINLDRTIRGTAVDEALLIHSPCPHNALSNHPLARRDDAKAKPFSGRRAVARPKAPSDKQRSKPEPASNAQSSWFLSTMALIQQAPEALESLTGMVETYLEGMVEATKSLALAARREHPIPTDFEHALRRHNISMSSLKPHLKPPIPKKQIVPSYANVLFEDQDAYTTLPLLGEELSGQPDKDEKEYVPASFPDFPSKHTYKFTPQEDVNVRDSKKIREEAARTAQQGEDALRRLVRASKMRKQKEVKLLVERDVHGKERFRLWESTMKRFMAAEGRGENTDQMEIADHSMIVNGEVLFSRKEIPRVGKRSAALTNKKAL